MNASNSSKKRKTDTTITKFPCKLIPKNVSDSNSNIAILCDLCSALHTRIFIPLNWYGRPKNETKFLKTSPIFLKFNQFNNCPFFLPNCFITLFSCLASKSS